MPLELEWGLHDRMWLAPGFRRTLYQIHLWVGLVLTLPLLVACITGTALLFKYDFIRWTVAGADQQLPARSPAEIGAALELIEQRFGDSIRTVRLADERIGLDEIWLADGRAAYFDPLRRSVVQEWERRSDPLDVLFNVHHHLLAGDVGTAIMGTVALLARTWGLRARPAEVHIVVETATSGVPAFTRTSAHVSGRSPSSWQPLLRPRVRN